MIRKISLLACVLLVACSGGSIDGTPGGTITQPFLGSSVVGIWQKSGEAAGLYNVQIRFTQDGAQLAGDWSAYDKNCSPLGGAACLKRGAVYRGPRTGTAVVFQLIVNTPNGYGGRFDGTMLSATSMSGTFFNLRRRQ